MVSGIGTIAGNSEDLAARCSGQHSRNQQNSYLMWYHNGYDLACRGELDRLFSVSKTCTIFEEVQCVSNPRSADNLSLNL